MIREKGTNKTWEEFYELYDKIADKLYECAKKQLKDKTSDHSCTWFTWFWDIDECTIVINDIKKDDCIIGIELTMVKNSFKEWIGSVQYYNDDFVDELYYSVAGEDAKEKLNSLYGRDSMYRKISDYSFQQMYPNNKTWEKEKMEE